MDLSQRVGTDWAALVEDVQSKRLARLESHIAASLALPNVHYRMVQRSLDEFCFRQVRAWAHTAAFASCELIEHASGAPTGRSRPMPATPQRCNSGCV
jgi:hypothetical protein